MSCSPVLTDYNGTDLTYDAVGNMTDYGNNLHFTWDKGNQLASVVFDLYNLTVSYKYDQNGMRTQKLMNGFVMVDYTYIGDRLISQTDYLDQTIDFIYDAMGDMIGVKYDGETYFYMRNLQGDVCGIYDSDGDLIVKYTYDAWGKRLNVTDANGVYISDLDSIAHVNPIRYRGYYYDSEFEFYYLQSRYYWPDLGRFISADSLFMAGDALVGTNMYAYCLNNPVMYVDPSGYKPFEGLDDFWKVLGYLGSMLKIFNFSEEVVKIIAAMPIGIILTIGESLFDAFFNNNPPLSIPMNESLLDKAVCSALGKEYDGANGRSADEIAIELYAHAVIYYDFAAVGEKINAPQAILDYIHDHGDPVDIGGDSPFRIWVFNQIWDKL